MNQIIDFLNNILHCKKYESYIRERINTYCKCCDRLLFNNQVRKISKKLSFDVLNEIEIILHLFVVHAVLVYARKRSQI